jgi:glycosyltransferase involved in cell wall biosynthesis
MKLDLLIPTHNRSKLLRKCLQSIRTATVPKEMEVTVWIVDNNSTDDTKQVALEFPEVRYLFVGKPGKSSALNESIAHTSSDFIGMIDDDEELDPRWFQVAFREFSEDAALEYIGGPYVPNWETETPEWFPHAFNGVGIVVRDERKRYTHDGSMLMGGNIVIRRKTLEKVLPYPEKHCKIGTKIRLGEDEVISNRLVDIGAVGMIIPDLIIHHWIPAERMTKKYSRQWVVGRAISTGSLLRDSGFKEPGLLGIPRYKFGKAARSAVAMVTAPDTSSRFVAQLWVLDCFATLYGRHFY